MNGIVHVSFITAANLRVGLQVSSVSVVIREQVGNTKNLHMSGLCLELCRTCALSSRDFVFFWGSTTCLPAKMLVAGRIKKFTGLYSSTTATSHTLDCVLLIDLLNGPVLSELELLGFSARASGARVFVD